MCLEIAHIRYYTLGHCIWSVLDYLASFVCCLAFSWFTILIAFALSVTHLFGICLLFVSSIIQAGSGFIYSRSDGGVSECR